MYDSTQVSLELNLKALSADQQRRERICFIILSYASKESFPSFFLSNRCELTFENAWQPFLLARIRVVAVVVKKIVVVAEPITSSG